MLGLFAQIKIFVLTLLLGGIAGFVIHFYQLGIKALGVGKQLLYLLDLLLWMFMILLVSLGMMLINQGALRFYTFVFLILGGVVYYKTLAPRLNRPLQVTAEALAHLLKRLVSMIIKPVRWLINSIRLQWRKFHPPMPPDDADV